MLSVGKKKKVVRTQRAPGLRLAEVRLLKLRQAGGKTKLSHKYTNVCMQLSMCMCKCELGQNDVSMRRKKLNKFAEQNTFEIK